MQHRSCITLHKPGRGRVTTLRQDTERTLKKKGSSVCVSLFQLGVWRLISGFPPHSGQGIVPARMGEGNGLLLQAQHSPHSLSSTVSVTGAAHSQAGARRTTDNLAGTCTGVGKGDENVSDHHHEMCKGRSTANMRCARADQQ